ncbi:hypothetical protein OEZ85_009358 [Tetradesmus obliquus]|uniref:Uncharacterized protein n=1 Tax=Tetradesmus obliquus TaxID=3088 RepID=A0ABY8U964_TETOB|nr:hypothetical protein OEZ85_009356 [Tetradesmus obliquus]WIA17852.1 hypothetical protein OEZ85_009357 [Tetradesmus obliquus]WIA17853.1 hypothetical protein OEZ85_009358 [Tetradesmus obliquus]
MAPAPKQKRVPCVTRTRAGPNSFCFIMGWEATCTGYSMATYATFKACTEDKEINKAMGPVVKCASIPVANRGLDGAWPLAHKLCLDAEPTQAQWDAGKAAWAKQDADEKAAAAKKAADEAKKAAAAAAAGAAAAAKGTWAVAQGKDILGADVPCNGNNDCLDCGTPQELKVRCGQLMSAGCAGFTYDSYTKCGYLKKAGGKQVAKAGTDAHTFTKK